MALARNSDIHNPVSALLKNHVARPLSPEPPASATAILSLTLQGIFQLTLHVHLPDPWLGARPLLLLWLVAPLPPPSSPAPVMDVTRLHWIPLFPATLRPPLLYFKSCHQKVNSTKVGTLMLCPSALSPNTQGSVE